MQTSSSAKRTCRECSSASEYTATVLMPSSRQARMIRRATSPRLAMRIFLNMPQSTVIGSLPGLDREQSFPVLNGLPVLCKDAGNLPVVLGVDLVHELHRFDDAEDLSLLDARSDLYERCGAGLGRTIEGPDDRRFDDDLTLIVDSLCRLDSGGRGIQRC